MIILPFILLAGTYGSAYARPNVARDLSISLPLVGEVNLARLGSVVKLDQARAAVLKQRLHAGGQHHRRRSASIDATNTAVGLQCPLSGSRRLMFSHA